MAEGVIGADQAIEKGHCVASLLACAVQFGSGYTIRVKDFLPLLDETHKKVLLNSSELSVMNKFGSMDGADGHSDELFTLSEEHNGFGELSFTEKQEESNYGVPVGGNGYAYQHKAIWSKFDWRTISDG